MTDKKYLKKMIAYVQKLEHSAEAEPFDSQIFHDTVELMQALNNAWNHSRRRHSFFMIVLCFVLICLAAWIVLSILW